MKVVLIKYNAGNVQSVMFALERIGVNYLLTDHPDEILTADRIIFPGVGEASTAMASLRENGLDQLIPSLKQPFLGTCVGMQLMCRHSEENDTKCLGIFDVEILKFPQKVGFKVPQTGWNEIFDLRSTLFEGVQNQSFVYYNNSYFAPVCPETVATSEHTVPFSGMLQKNNFYAAQFHSEISGAVGQTIFENFMKL